MQTFQSGSPPILSMNLPLANRIFSQGESEQYMVSLKHKGEKALWYNGEVEPNVGTCIYLEVGVEDGRKSDQSVDSSFCSDAELMDFL